MLLGADTPCYSGRGISISSSTISKETKTRLHYLAYTTHVQGSRTGHVRSSVIGSLCMTQSKHEIRFERKYSSCVSQRPSCNLKSLSCDGQGASVAASGPPISITGSLASARGLLRRLQGLLNSQGPCLPVAVTCDLQRASCVSHRPFCIGQLASSEARSGPYHV